MHCLSGLMQSKKSNGNVDFVWSNLGKIGELCDVFCWTFEKCIYYNIDKVNNSFISIDKFIVLFNMILCYFIL